MISLFAVSGIGWWWLDFENKLPKLERMEYKIPSPYRGQNIWYVVLDILKNWYSGIIFVFYFAM